MPPLSRVRTKLAQLGSISADAAYISVLASGISTHYDRPRIRAS